MDKVINEIDKIVSENKIIATLIQKYKSNISFLKERMSLMDNSENPNDYEYDLIVDEQQIICYTEMLNDLKKLY